MTAYLRQQGHPVNHKRVQRLMQSMGLQAIYPKARTMVRYVIAWQLSNTLEGQFCREALDASLQQGHSDIFNTDQGVQFTAT